MAPRSSFVLALLAASRLAPVFAGVQNVKLNIENKQLSPDGVNRSTVTANGVVPGTLISGYKGDQFLINVTDSLTDSTMRRATSIHWHGIFQEHTTEMDGPAFVSQCPIVPSHSFLYNFTVPDQTGTYWYHSHLSTQYCDGLRGPLVIYDPEDPLKYMYDVDDESTVITLLDWYHTVAPQIIPNSNHNIPINPDSTLINGRGRWSGDPTSDLAVVRAQPGQRHRFRLISTSCDPSFTFSIDGHNLTIIEVDGVETEPVTVDSLEIFAAQRYSVVVTMDKPADNYWIRAIPSKGNGTTIGGINSAILRYDGALACEPNSTANPDGVSLKETDLHPLYNTPVPGERYPGGADIVIPLAVAFDITQGLFTLNGVAFNPPTMPVLLQILSGATSASSLLPNGSVYTLEPNKTVEVSFTGAGEGGGSHPFHLHGHTFRVIRSVGNDTYNYDNPVERDTVNIGGSDDLVTFRFRTDNPGPWFLHCHIDWHLDIGLAVVFAEDAPGVAKNDPNNTAWNNLCPLYDKYNPDKNLPSPFNMTMI